MNLFYDNVQLIYGSMFRNGRIILQADWSHVLKYTFILFTVDFIEIEASC